MAGQREDYLLREIARLRQLLEAVLVDPRPPEINHALELALRLQVRLFPLPPVEFLQLDAFSQFEHLCAGLKSDEAAEKVLTYSELLAHAASLYELQERADLALGARQLALHMALLAAIELSDTAADSLVVLLRRSLAGEHLHAPVQELCGSFDRLRGWA